MSLVIKSDQSTTALKKKFLDKNTPGHYREKFWKELQARITDRGDQLRLLAYFSGYKTTPPTFREFRESPDFAGSLAVYETYVELGEQIFSTPWGSPYTVVMNSSAIGTGKTYSASVYCLYELTRMLHLECAHTRYNLDHSTKLTLALIAPTLELGQSILLDPVDEMISQIPFLQKPAAYAISKKMKTRFPNNIDIKVMSRVQQSVGRAIFTGCADEISDSIVAGQAEKIIRSVLRRMESRFGSIDGSFSAGRLYIMSSARSDSSVFEVVKRDLTAGSSKRVLTLNHTQWDIKPDKFSKEMFPVFIGDATADPYIPDPDDPIINDSDRIIQVPENTRSAFEANAVEALQDLAGVVTSTSMRFFPAKGPVVAACAWPNATTKDVIYASLKDRQTTRLLDYIKIPQLKSSLQKNACVISMDPAFSANDTSDSFGFAISFVDGWQKIKRYDANTGKEVVVSQPRILTPLVLEFRGEDGIEVSFGLIEDLVIDLRSSGIQIACVTADQVGRTMLQRLTVAGFETKYVSVDRTKDAYLELRRTVVEGRWIGPKLNSLTEELLSLLSGPKKVDHPLLPGSSKDLADVVAASTFTALQLVEEGAEQFNDGSFGEMLDALQGQIEEDEPGMIESRLPNSAKRVLTTADVFGDSEMDEFESIFD